MKRSRKIRRCWLRNIPEWMKCFARSVTRIVKLSGYQFITAAQNAGEKCVALALSVNSKLRTVNSGLKAHANDWAAIALAAGLVVAPYSINLPAASQDPALRAQNCLAAPENGTVVGGEAAITQNGAVTNITQTSQRAAIDWASFDIAKTESVNFSQPSADAALLNRVNSGVASQILGTINANGHIYIVNPYGISVGNSASVSANGVYLSTTDISSAAFMLSQLPDSRSSVSGTGNIIMSGSIRAGEIVVLDGTRNIIVNGLIDASAVNGSAGTIKLVADMSNGILDVTDACLYAYGGNEGGNGGFIETSGYEVAGLDKITVSAAAPKGTAGVWLIDPTDLIITKAIASDYQTTLNGGTSVTNQAASITMNSDASIFKTTGARATLALIATAGNINLTAGSWINCYSTTPDSTSFGTLDVSISASGNVTLNEMELGDLPSTQVPYGNLSVTAGGLITSPNNIMAANAVFNAYDSITIGGALNVSSANLTAVNATHTGKTITMTNTGNKITTAAFTCDILSLLDSTALTLGESHLSSNATIRSYGDISQSSGFYAGTLAAVALDASNTHHNITLNNANNGISLIAATGSNISLRSDSGFTVTSVIARDESLPGASGALTLTAGTAAGNNITVSGSVDLGTGGSLSVSGYDIDFVPASYTHTAGSLTASGHDLKYKNNSSLALGGTSLSSIYLTAAAGNISQTTAVTAGFAEFTATAGSNSVILNDSGNDFGDLSVICAANTTSTITLTDKNSVTLYALTGGTISVTALTGDINGSALNPSSVKIDAYGPASFKATGGNISLLHYNSGYINQFRNTLALTGANGEIGAASGVTLSGAALSGYLSISCGGNVYDYGTVVVGGPVAVTTPGNSIILDEPGTSFSTAALTGAAIYVAVPGALALSGVSASGTLGLNVGGNLTQTGTITAGATTIDAGSYNILLNTQNNDFTSTISLTGGTASIFDTGAGTGTEIDLAASTIGTLNLSAWGNIGQSVGITVSGAANFTARNASLTGKTILLNASGNNFGSISLNSQTATIYNERTTTLGDSIVNGTATVRAYGAISQTGSMTAGTISATALSADNGTYYDISLANSANNLGLAAATGKNISLRSDAGFSVGTIKARDESLPGATGSLTLTAATTSGKNITAAGTIDVGNGSISATGYDINFVPASYVHTAGALSVTGYSLTYKNSGGLALGTSSVGAGGSSVTLVTGNLTQSGALNISGDTRFTTSAAGSSIGLDNVANNFSTIYVTGSNTSPVVITDADSVILGSINSGALTISTVTGNINSPGSPDNSNYIFSHGAARFSAAGGTGSITLTHFDLTDYKYLNQFSDYITLSGATAVLGAASDLNFGESVLTGNMTARSYSSIGQGSPLSVGGILDLTAMNYAGTVKYNISLNATGNHVGQFTATGNTISFTESDATDLGNITAGAALTIVSGGGITDSGNISAAATSSFQAAGEILIDGISNTFTGAITADNSSTAGAFDISFIGGTGAVTFASVLADQDFNVNYAGGATCTGSVIANRKNDFSQDVILSSAGSLNAPETRVGRDLTVNTGSSLYNNVTVFRTSSMSGTVRFGGTPAFTTGDLTIANGTNLYACESGTTPDRNLALYVNNYINNGGTIHVSGYNLTIAPKTSGTVLTVGATTGSGLIISGTEIGNRLQANTLIIGDNNSGDVTLNGSVTKPAAINNLKIISNGSLTQSSGSLDWAATKTVTLQLGGTAALTNTGNDFDYLDYTGKSLTVSDKNSLYFSDVVVSDTSGTANNLSVTTLGEIGQSLGGTMNIAGTTTMTNVHYNPGVTNHAIYLSNSGNVFTGAVSLTGLSATIKADNGLTMNNLNIGAPGSAAGLTATAPSGNIVFAGTNNISDGGNVTVDVDAGAKVLLDATGKISTSGGTMTLKGGSGSQFVLGGNSATGKWDGTRNSFDNTTIQTNGSVGTMYLYSDKGFKLGNIATTGALFMDIGGTGNTVSQVAGTGITMSGAGKYLTVRNGSYILDSSLNNLDPGIIISTGYTAITDTNDALVNPAGNIVINSSAGYRVGRLKANGNITLETASGTVSQIATSDTASIISLVGNSQTLALVNTSPTSQASINLTNTENLFQNSAFNTIVDVTNIQGLVNLYAKDSYTLNTLSFSSQPGGGTLQANAGMNLTLIQAVDLTANSASRLYLGAGNLKTPPSSLDIGTGLITASLGDKKQLILWSGLTASNVQGTITISGMGGSTINPHDFFDPLIFTGNKTFDETITAYSDTGALYSDH